jgi:hypothetical protein
MKLTSFDIILFTYQIAKVLKNTFLCTILYWGTEHALERLKQIFGTPY